MNVEQDPYLREIWAAGYDQVLRYDADQELLLIRSRDGFTKRIQMVKPTDNYTIIRAILYSGETYNWISNRDGSGERFRSLICPE
jgi:hypothetical protein